jgi:tetratricopeptide (TPR) repeat protein
MDALISGQAGAAAVLGRNSQLRRLGEMPADMPLHLLGRIFAGTTDVSSCKVATAAELDAIARRAWSADRGLRMLLMLMDQSEPQEELSEYAACLEELLAESSVDRFIRQNMYSEPLPALVEAERITAILSDQARASRLLSDLLRDQAQIDRVRRSFEAIPLEVFGNAASKSAAFEAAIAHRAFVDLVDALNRNADVNFVVLKLLALTRDVEGMREIIAHWTAGMRKARAQESGPAAEPEEDFEPSDDGSKAATTLDQAITNFQQRKPWELEGSSADLPGIKREIAWIGERLKFGETTRAERALAELIDRQGRRSRAEDVVKTLTSVADLARGAKLFDWTLWLLSAIDKVGVPDAHAMTVRAETLRDLGRYEEALAALEEAMRRFPQNEVAPTARAETLRDLGRYEEALAALEEAMRRFPQNEVAPNARAETLRDLGRYDEALAAFEETMRRFPQDAVAPTARAETLRDLDRYEEALAALEETMRRFPQNEVAPNAYAHLLAERGRLHEAESVLLSAATRSTTRGDWIAVHVLAMAKVRVGRIEEAIADFERGIACKFLDVRKYFEAGRTIALIAGRRADEAARQLEILAQNRSLRRDELTNIVLFHTHALAEAGELPRARALVRSATIIDFAAAKQKLLARALAERYALVPGATVTPQRAQQLSDTITTLEFQLVRPKPRTFQTRAA